jgi:hypothetical protein
MASPRIVASLFGATPAASRETVALPSKRSAQPRDPGADLLLADGAWALSGRSPTVLSKPVAEHYPIRIAPW